MKEEWILVASREEAKLFARTGAGPLRLICDMGNPRGLLKEQDLTSDAPGRSTDNRMRARHAYSSQESAKERALKDFYREVSERLERGLYAHEFDTLTLIAEPRLLGIIREILPFNVKRTITREIAKDLSYEDERALLSRLQ